MKKLLFALIMCATLASCMTQQRAERKIERLVARFPELRQVEVVTIDTTIFIPERRDSTVFAMYGTGHRKPVEVKTGQGAFTMAVDTVTKLVKVTYTAPPDTIFIEKTVEVPKVVVQSADHRRVQRWRTVALVCLALTLPILAFFIMAVRWRNKDRQRKE